MKLTEQEKQMLIGWGYLESDIPQLCKAARLCKYENNKGETMTAKKAISLIGRKEWISGISRAAFHWDCGRGEGENYVFFDCSALFK